jgi:hypothetical protein
MLSKKYTEEPRFGFERLRGNLRKETLGKWVTRRRIHVDRAATGWLIRRQSHLPSTLSSTLTATFGISRRSMRGIHGSVTRSEETLSPFEEYVSTRHFLVGSRSNSWNVQSLENLEEAWKEIFITSTSAPTGTETRRQ